MVRSASSPRGARERRLASVLGLAALSIALGACGASAEARHRVSLATAAATVPGAGAGAGSTRAQGVAEAPCGSAAAQAAASAVLLPAERIYRLELSSAEVRADQRQVEGYLPLLNAVAAGDKAAATAAVNTLVYSHTHIVRLRVTHSGSLLSDVGGPYIIAPVSGSLRLHGRVVGGYVLSVQDDLGYVKLESRYIGVPLLLRQGSHAIPVEGMIAPGASTIPDNGPVSYRGGRYQAISFAAEAFPSGPLKVTLLVPTPPSTLLGCGAIRAFELGAVGQSIWHRFASVSASPASFVTTAASLTGALVYVRAGARQLAGSTSPGPRRLPAAGTVVYRGVSYRVSSFAASTATGPVRIYELIAP